MATKQGIETLTKKQLIELVYLNVSGGKLSSDVNVKRVDINFYFPVAYNYAVLYDYYERHNLMVSEMRNMGFSQEGKILGELLITYPVTAQKDTSRNLDYIVLPKKLMTLPAGRGLDSLFGGDPESLFVKVTGQSDVIGLEPPGSGFFWFEKCPSEDRVYIKGLHGTDCTLYLRMLADAGDIGLNDEISFPSGREQMIIDKMVEFFAKERGLPENVVNENVDDIIKK